jgi:hypothetical protein
MVEAAAGRGQLAGCMTFCGIPCGYPQFISQFSQLKIIVVRASNLALGINRVRQEIRNMQTNTSKLEYVQSITRELSALVIDDKDCRTLAMLLEMVEMEAAEIAKERYNCPCAA